MENSGEATKISSLEELLNVVHDAASIKQISSIVQEVVVVNNGMGLGHLPPAVSQFTALQRLDLSGNAITQIPFSVANLVNLKVMNVSRNQITAILPDLSTLTSLVDMDASRNQIQSVPSPFCQLSQLQFLNLMGNKMTKLPDDFGSLVGLKRLGLKSNQLTQLPDSFTQLTNLVELFITDNKLESFPPGIGNLRSLVKLQASFNSLTHLPEDLFMLPALEMCRVAVCNISALPQDMLQLAAHKLAWFSLGGNPVCPDIPSRPNLVHLDMGQVEMGRKLGDGASGEVFAGSFENNEVAVKIFRSDVSPDGRTDEEIAISCFVEHKNLVRIRGLIQEPHALLMDLVNAQQMADKPVFEPLLRCRWAADTSFTTRKVVSVASGIASALQYLHSHCICHGDVYAHNILVDDDGRATLCDFGAAFCYPSDHKFWEIMEVRAFGLFLRDLVARIADGDEESSAKLAKLVADCVDSEVQERPTFTEALAVLADLS